MDKHVEVGACPFSNYGKVERWKVRKTCPCCCNPGTQSPPDLQQRKTRIGQLNLCRMKLPYRQRQQERASRVRRDHKLALRTAFAALLLVTTSVVSATATIQPPEKDCHHTRAALLDRSRGQVRERRDFSVEKSHKEARLQEASHSS